MLFLNGCSRPEKEVQVVTQVQKVQIPLVARPKPVQLTDTKVYVVNSENVDDFLKEFEEIHGTVAFVALSMKDYENLALNVAELKRFLNQQTDIIVYYEEAVVEEKGDKVK
jgi:hypothetical protein